MNIYRAQISIIESINGEFNSYKFKEYLIQAKLYDKGFSFAKNFGNIFISSIYDANNVEMSYGFKTNGSFRTTCIENPIFKKPFKAWADVYSILSFYIFYRAIKYISQHEIITLFEINDKNCLFLLKPDIKSILPLIKFIDSNDKSILVNPIEDVIKIFEEYPELKEFENSKDIKYLEMLK